MSAEYVERRQGVLEDDIARHGAERGMVGLHEDFGTVELDPIHSMARFCDAP